MPAPFFTSVNNNKIASMVRVNHAGEYAAKKIYEGQLKYIQDEDNRKIINKMLVNEEEHLAFFTKELINRDIRPTILILLWQYLSYYLGAMSISLGIKEAMLLTASVEETIEKHYLGQINLLNGLNIEHDLTKNIEQFMLDEVNHGTTAMSYLANSSNFMKFKKHLISMSCNFAIFLSKIF